MEFFDEHLVVGICFVIFLYLVYRPVRRVIVNSLDSKISEIRQKLEEAQKLKEDAKLLFLESQAKLDLFETKKGDKLKEVENNTQQMIKDEIKRIDKEFLIKKDLILKSITNKKTEALSGIYQEFVDETLQKVKDYLATTGNNSVKDEQILEIFTKEKK